MDAENHPPAEPSKPSGALAGIAAALPTLFLAVGCVLFGVLTARNGPAGAGHAVEEMGIWFWALIAATLAAWIGTTVLLFLAGRGVRAPGAITLLVAALPWLVGLAGVLGGVSVAAGAVEHADPASRATMMAMGISEATNARMLGAILSSALFAAVAFGWGVSAIGQRAKQRSGLGAALGIGVALPLLGLAVYGATAAWLAAAGLVLAGLGAPIAMALGGAGAGAEDAHGRSGALAASTPIAAGLAVLAGAAAASSASLVEVLAAVAVSASDNRPALIGMGAQALAPLGWVLDLALPLTLAAAAALAGWAFTKAKPSAGRLAGGAALVLAAGLVFGLDAGAMAWTSSRFEDVDGRAWRDVPGFEPVTLAPDPDGGDIAALLTPTGLAAVDGAAMAPYEPDEPAPLRAALARLVGEARAGTPTEDEPEWLREPGSDPARGSESDAEILHAPTDLTLAVDRRVSAAQLRQLLDAAAAAELRAVAFVGADVDAPSEAQQRAIRETLPMLVFALSGRGGVRVLLEPALADGMPERDRILHHVTVGASLPTTTEIRPGAPAAPEDRILEAASRRRYDREETPLYVAFGDAASAEAVLQTAANASTRGFVPILVTGAIPGHPERSGDPMTALRALMGEPGGDDDGARSTESGPIGIPHRGTIGLGDRDTHGFGGSSRPPGSPPRVRAGSADVRGSLSSDVIRRIVGRHSNEIRFCHEQGLGRDPSLEGRVTVSFIISPTGAVQSATVNSSTLGDPGVEGCITRAVRRWVFPAPDGGGVVGVNYPFTLSPG